MAGFGVDNQVQDFMEVTQATKKEATDYLTAANNSLERAIEMFYTGGLQNPQFDPEPSQWNEAEFHQDRSGTFTEAASTPAFQINAHDDHYDFPYNQWATPTRPPSRTSHKSVDSAMAMVPSTGRSSRMDFERDQESGVLGNSHPYFGPATKPHYETSQWALTLAGPTVSQNIPDVEVTRRKRSHGEPVLLKPMANGDYLPPLITILCSIPTIRDAFLLDLGPGKSVDYDSNWWSGSSIQGTGAIIVEAETIERDHLNLLRETQRLTAFLEGTHRAYGSVDALARLEALESEHVNKFIDGADTELVFQRFLIAWETAAAFVDPEWRKKRLFHSTLENEDQKVEVRCIDAKIPPQSTWKTIYDLLDGLIFVDDPQEDTASFPSITSLGQTFILRIEQENQYLKGLDIEIPEVLYLDRYMRDRLPVTRPLRQEMARYKDFVQRLEEKEEQMQGYKHPRSNKNFNPLKLVEKAMQAFRRPTEFEQEAYEEEGIPEDPEGLDILEQLRSIHERIQSGLQELEAQKVNALKALDDAAGFFKSLSVDPDLSPTREYLLRGVSTESNVTYVYQDRPHEAIETKASDMAHEASADGGQSGGWWRLEYSYISAVPSLLREKVTRERVRLALNEEGRSALLVYASRDAISSQLSATPEHLVDFVKKDNAAFQEELDSVQATGEWDDSANCLANSNVDWDATKAPVERSHYKPFDWSGHHDEYQGGKGSQPDMADARMTEMTQKDSIPSAHASANSGAEADQLMDDVVESIEADGTHHIEHGSYSTGPTPGTKLE